MPALTHGRENGFNGPNRKLASNKRPAGDLVVKKVVVKEMHNERRTYWWNWSKKRIGTRCYKKKNSKRKC